MYLETLDEEAVIDLELDISIRKFRYNLLAYLYNMKLLTSDVKISKYQCPHGHDMTRTHATAPRHLTYFRFSLITDLKTSLLYVAY